MPRLIGQIRGTPTIKYIYPNNRKNKPGSNKRKIVLDYQGAREVKAMKEYAETKMPNYVERITSVKKLDAFIEKANKYGLPKAILFTKLRRTSASLKALSTEYRRKLLIGEVRAGKHNKPIFDRYKNDVKSLPACIVLGEDGAKNNVFGKKPTFNRLNFWFAKFALKKQYFNDPVAQARIAARKGDTKEEPKKEKSKKKKQKEKSKKKKQKEKSKKKKSAKKEKAKKKKSTKREPTEREKETGFREEL